MFKGRCIEAGNMHRGSIQTKAHAQGQHPDRAHALGQHAGMILAQEKHAGRAHVQEEHADRTRASSQLAGDEHRHRHHPDHHQNKEKGNAPTKIQTRNQTPHGSVTVECPTTWLCSTHLIGRVKKKKGQRRYKQITD